MIADELSVEAQPHEREPFRVRLPGFVTETEIGLGDLASRAAASVGIRPCGGCAGRAGTLNKWLVISPWRSR